jgi:hypothetical protein
MASYCCVIVAISAATELANDLVVKPKFQNKKKYICLVIGNFRYKAFYELNMVLEDKFGTEVFSTSLDTISAEEKFKEVLHYIETWRVLCKTCKMPK